MLITEPTAQDPGKPSRKVVSITIAVLVHLFLAVIAALIVISTKQKPEPEIVAQVVQPTETAAPQMEKKAVMKQIEQASSSSAASPIAKMIRANTTARIAAPEVTKISDGPLGLGEGDFGSGFGSGSGGGLGGGATFFGNATSSGLVGRLYDMKQDRNRKGVAYDPSAGAFFSKIRAVSDKRFSEAALKDYYRAKVKLSFTYLAVPYIAAEEGPKAFQSEKEIEPRGWFVHYSGSIAPPREGEWRFHGFFDDCLVVFINHRPVFDGSWDPAMNDNGIRQESTLPRFVNAKPMFQGKWVKLKSGDKIDILVGERPGGFMGGTLMIEEKGENYSAGKLPLFSTVRVGSKDWARIQETGYAAYHKETPVFRLASRKTF